MRILIAEDDDVSRLLMERLLQKAGYDIISTPNGFEAFEAFKDNKVDMAILDWMMPEMDGIEVTQEIRKIEDETETSTYILMVTAKSEAEDMMHALSIGVDDFLTKPVDRLLLEKRIEAGLKYQNFLKMKKEFRQAPHLVLKSEHEIFRNMVHIFDVIYDELETGVPDDVIKWSTSTLTQLTLKLHQEKEDFYFQTFIDILTSEHVDWFSQISESSFVTLTEEHEELESRLMNIQGQISQYFLKENPDAISLRTSIKFYTDLLLRHMYREENIFFPFAQKYIAYEQIAELFEKFKQVDKEYGINEINKSIAEIKNLLDELTRGEQLSNWRAEH